MLQVIPVNIVQVLAVFMLVTFLAVIVRTKVSLFDRPLLEVSWPPVPTEPCRGFGLELDAVPIG